MAQEGGGGGCCAKSSQNHDGNHRLSLKNLVAASLTWTSAFRLGFLLLLFAAISIVFISLPIDTILKKFLFWIKQDLGPWGPLALAFAYIPLTVFAVPASILTLGGGYLFGLPVGFMADSVGATLGATMAFLIGRTIGRSYVLSKLSDYLKFQAVAIAIQRSGFKIVFLLRLVPLLPFNMLNYLLSVTPIGLGQYMLGSWLGMMPSTFALVYIGTTVKDLSGATHGWNEISTTHWVIMALAFVASVVLIVCITKVAKASLDKALVENTDKGILAASTPTMLPIVAEYPFDLHKPLMADIDSIREDDPEG